MGYCSVAWRKWSTSSLKEVRRPLCLLTKRSLVKRKGLAKKSSVLPCSLPVLFPVPLCSTQCHEFPTEHVTELSKWWLLILLCTLVLLWEGSELLSQLVDYSHSSAHGVRCFTGHLFLLSKALCPVAHSYCRHGLQAAVDIPLPHA